MFPSIMSRLWRVSTEAKEPDFMTTKNDEIKNTEKCKNVQTQENDNNNDNHPEKNDPDILVLNNSQVSVYQVDGIDAQEMIEEGIIEIDNLTLTFSGVCTANKKEKKSIVFEYSLIKNFRRHQNDMFQWTYINQKGEDRGCYGLLFVNDVDIEVFFREVYRHLIEEINIYKCIPCNYKFYSNTDKKWIDIDMYTHISIGQRLNSRESYICVWKNKYESKRISCTTSSSDDENDGEYYDFDEDNEGIEGVDKKKTSCVTNREENEEPSVSMTVKTPKGRAKAPRGAVKLKKNSKKNDTLSTTTGKKKRDEKTKDIINEIDDSDKPGKTEAIDDGDKPAKTEAIDNSGGGVTTTTTHHEKNKNKCIYSHKSEDLVNILPVNENEFIFPDQNKKEITWWGMDETFTERKMYGVDLFNHIENKKKETTQKYHDHDHDESIPSFTVHDNDILFFFELLQNAAAEAIAGRVIQNGEKIDEVLGYDTNSFDNTIQDWEMEEKVEWGDANSEESENDDSSPIVQHDPTRNVWKSDPHAMLSTMMKVGEAKSFVFRSSGENTHTRQNDIQVFSFDEYGKQNIVSTIDDNKLSYNETKIYPSAALLHDRSEKLLLCDNTDNGKVYIMDVEKEKVVQEFKSDEFSIKNIMYTHADDYKNYEKTFIAYNQKGFLNVDIRENQQNQLLTYQTKVNFTTGATNKDGNIAMGNNKGEIRLYDGDVNKDYKYKRAKNLLPSLGDPILYIDVLKDGSWILATCEKYLLLFPIKEIATNKTGFIKTFQNEKKPKPLILKLKKKDIFDYNLQDINFNKAFFDDTQTLIITSTNNLVILWDFTSVKKGDMYAYSIRKAKDYIKDVAVVNDLGRECVVMATPSYVATKSLKKLSETLSPKATQ